MANDKAIEQRRFHKGDRVYLHYCGGTAYGTVIKVNRKSVRVISDEDGDENTWPINDRMGKVS